MQTKVKHRGAGANGGEFAKKFVLARLDGFEKDIHICLKPAPSKSRPGPTHAYFPALATCCGFLEYLTVLYRGSTNSPGWRNISNWALRYMRQPDYNEERVRILVEHFRHSVAHRGIATGVWVDREPGPEMGRRLTWKVSADALRPSIHIVPEANTLVRDSPWPCSYTHRVHIHLRALAIDLREGARSYAQDVSGATALQEKFFECMHRLYPN